MNVLLVMVVVIIHVSILMDLTIVNVLMDLNWIVIIMDVQVSDM